MAEKHDRGSSIFVPRLKVIQVTVETTIRGNENDVKTQETPRSLREAKVFWGSTRVLSLYQGHLSSHACG